MTSRLISTQRLWHSLMEMGAVGALPHGGCCRTALSDADKAGRDLFVRWCREAGCKVTFDQIGNIYARRAGRDNDWPAVATGSHLDTQPHGGKFDGIYGVLAGLEVVRALNDGGVETKAPLDVIVWTNEEGVRFSPPLTGSSVVAGKFTVPFVHAAITLDGTTVREDLEAIGYLGEEAPGARTFNCFVEAHIEQGPLLEASDHTIGVVTRVQGVRWLRVCLTGQDGHAGTTPMDCRRDALLGAASIVTALNQLARDEDEQARLTVGKLEILPNSGATIPGGTVFIVDFRHPDGATLDRLEQGMRRVIQSIAEAHGLETGIERLIDAPPVPFNQEMVNIVRRNADRLGYLHMDMLSGAGHDAMNIASLTPTSMIFVPCKGGISHNEAESANPDDLAAGANVLLHTLLERAG
ncbi:MAG: M20 family metallo-hydrolase, partial [Xanthomonadales bacterium]|nr:M20 family metallo-hydrolase [Xanthomonadales bacterium]